MPRLRSQNIQAAQWSPNGGGIGQSDLTQPGANTFGANTFSPVRPAPAAAQERLQRAEQVARGGRAARPALADTVAAAMKDWAIEHGATHFTHWFQPLTGSTAEKHDCVHRARRRRRRDRGVLGQGADPGRARRVVVPVGRHPRHVRGARLHRVGPDVARRSSSRTATARTLCIPTAFASWTGEALDQKTPLLRSMRRAVDAQAVRCSSCSATTRVQQVFTTLGAEQEYFLIDEEFYFARPDLITTGRTLFGAKPPKGQRARGPLLRRRSPSACSAYMLDVEHELFKLGVPIKTRHNEVAPASSRWRRSSRTPTSRTDHQHADRWRCCGTSRRATASSACCTRSRSPGINGSGKHNNWSIATDTRREPARAGRHAARQPAVPGVPARR